VDWYDIAIVEEEVLGQLGEDVLSLEGQWEFLVAQMSKIKAVLLAADSSKRLNLRRERRAIRRLGILYSPPPISS
jgi:predicted N-acyltransferase